MEKPPTPETKRIAVPMGQHSPSLFGPVVLIAVGVYFLLSNLGMAPLLNWGAALRLWPLLLVMWGLNIIVRQVRGPLGAVLSALVGLLAVLIFGTVLFFADSIPLLSRWSGPAGGEVQRERIAYDEDVTGADLNIDFSSAPATLTMDPGAVIEGEVTYIESLTFDTSRRGDQANIRLDTRNSPSFVFFSFGQWTDFDDSERWQLTLSPTVLFDMNLDLSSGTVELDLSGLQLSDFSLDGGSGAWELALPAGEYDAFIDMGSGQADILLPAGGGMNVELDGGSGRLGMMIPADLAARLEFDVGSGAVNVADRFELVTDSGDTRVWQSSDYDDAAERVLIMMTSGSGGVNVR